MRTRLRLIVIGLQTNQLLSIIVLIIFFCLIYYHIWQRKAENHYIWNQRIFGKTFYVSS